MFKRFGLGVSSYFDAHRLIVKHNLWGYLLVPGIINLILFCFFLWGVFTFSDNTATYILKLLGISEKDDSWLGFITEIIFVVLSFILKLLLLVIYLSIYKYITLTLLSPVLAMLSERTEKILTGADFKNTPLQLVKDFFRGVKLAIRNFLIEMLCIVLGYFLLYIPIINLFIPIILFFVSSYFMGFSMIDYTNERHKLNSTQSLLFARKNKGAVMGTGFIFNLLFLIPFIGWIVAPGYAVVAATISTHKIKNNLV